VRKGINLKKIRVLFCIFPGDCYVACTLYHGFKNRTGPAGSTGSTGNRYLIRSGSLKKSEIWKKMTKTGNRWFNRKNREPKRLNRFWPSLTNFKTTPFWSIFPYPKPNLQLRFSLILPSRRFPLPASSFPLTLTHASSCERRKIKKRKERRK
jgi:hypothetical protein